MSRSAGGGARGSERVYSEAVLHEHACHSLFCGPLYIAVLVYRTSWMSGVATVSIWIQVYVQRVGPHRQRRSCRHARHQLLC